MIGQGVFQIRLSNGMLHFILRALIFYAPISAHGGLLQQRWSWFFDHFAALLRWIRVSCQAAILIGSFWLA